VVLPRSALGFAAGLVTGVAAILAACSGGNAAPTCAAHQVPASTNLLSPQVSFQTDVLPTFEASCGLSASCHASASAISGRIFLGSKNTPTDPTMVHDGLVGTASGDLPTMPYVTAGDPSKSFLMHKMDGDQCLFDSQCAASVTAGTGCGGSMPQNLPLLDVAARDTVRRWIAQGAAND